ncbi:MAG: phosphatidylserine/phosphatidylglycerophosphate/cardiolipin synthase family protein [Gemmatimonadetes bacterium]|nr:phosphatidylserine/phosphatidylglycerophosphate/cardiolipin synthase family protein [Gemmatimonadota bacterium]
MRFELLVGATEFWARLQDDLRSAHTSAYVETFTFEGDRVGLALGHALERCPALDRRLLVDCYSLLYHSDRIIPSLAWLDPALRREVMITHRWVRRLRSRGVGVRFSNPLGPSPAKLVRRNHKKIAVFDGRVAYLGGMNFSEHNFAWHDMMFRVECEDLSGVLASDFLDSWEGEPTTRDRRCGALRVLSLNGRGNREGMAPVVDAMSSAVRSIDVMSPYLSPPFTDHLSAAQGRGVEVRVLAPAQNNKANLARHIVESAHRGGFDLFLSEGMSHLKAMLIDGELLIVGSSNFDFMSYTLLDELVVMTRDSDMVDAFLERVWRPDLARAERTRPRSSRGTRFGHAAVRLGALVADALTPA